MWDQIYQFLVIAYLLTLHKFSKIILEQFNFFFIFVGNVIDYWVSGS